MKRMRPGGILLTLAFAASLCVLGFGAYRLWRVQHTLDDGATRLRRQMEATAEKGNAASGTTDGYDLDGFTALGILTFRGDAATAAPVYLGTGNDVLEKGVGLAEDTATLNQPGNAVLFGHRDSAFRAIEHLKVDDSLTLETAAGSRTYTVRDIYITHPEDPHIYDESAAVRLTLVTCYPFSFVGPAPERCVVIAEAA